MNSTKEIILKRRYKDRLTYDASDYVNMLFGTAFHSLFETEGEGSEMRVEHKVGRATLSGRVDSYKDGVVTDYKTTTVYKVKSGDFSDWEKQVLIYAWLLSKNGEYVKEGVVQAFLKDFSKMRKAFDKDYPESQVYTHVFKITTQRLMEIEEFIINKVGEIERHIDAENSELPEPLDEELWRTPDKYAVMKNGGGRALRVFDDLEEAQQFLSEKGADYIEERKGVYKKLEYDEGLAELFRIGEVEKYKPKREPDR